MTGIFHTKVRLSGYPFPDSQLTVKLAAGITNAHVGLALTQDISAANTMKLAGDNDAIAAVLYSVEERVVEGQLLGTACFRFARKMKVKAGLSGAAIVGVGSRLCGAGAGEVKAIDLTGTPLALTALLAAHAPRVWELIGTEAVATKI